MNITTICSQNYTEKCSTISFMLHKINIIMSPQDPKQALFSNAIQKNI